MVVVLFLDRRGLSMSSAVTMRTSEVSWTSQYRENSGEGVTTEANIQNIRRTKKE